MAMNVNSLKRARNAIIASLLLPFLYHAFRFVELRERLGEFMCNSKAGDVAGIMLFIPLWVSAFSVVIEGVFFRRGTGWLGMATVQDVLNAQPPLPNWRVLLFANICGVIALSLLSMMGCWLSG